MEGNQRVNMIKVCNVTKKYKKNYALRDVSFVLGTGVYGLIGENGAGKTTIMKLFTRQIRANQGQIFYEQSEWDDKCKAKVGYLPQNFEFFDNLTVLEALDYLQLVRSSKTENSKAEILKWLEYLNLTPHTDKKIRKLSGGMRQRLGIAQAFMGEPEIILLDEPTVGLDPKERLAFRNMVNEVCDKKTILISTHILDDVESTCEKMISLKQGQVIYEGKISDFIRIEQGNVYAANFYREDISKIGEEISVIAVKREGGMVNIRFVIQNQALLDSIDFYKKASIKKVETNLEDAYFLNTYLRPGKQVCIDV